MELPHFICPSHFLQHHPDFHFSKVCTPELQKHTHPLYSSVLSLFGPSISFPNGTATFYLPFPFPSASDFLLRNTIFSWHSGIFGFFCVLHEVHVTATMYTSRSMTLHSLSFQHSTLPFWSHTNVCVHELYLSTHFLDLELKGRAATLVTLKHYLNSTTGKMKTGTPVFCFLHMQI
jgi:hypothetical protein